MPKKDSYKSNLLSISDGLSDENLSHMLFLCGDVLSRQESACVRTGHELFQLLEEKRKLDADNKHFLADLLAAVGQDWLLDHLDREMHGVHPYRCQLKLARLYVMNVGMELGVDDFRRLKSACDCTREEVTEYYQLITYLENRKKISIKQTVDVSFLIEALEKAGMFTDSQSKLPTITEEFQKQLRYEEDCYRMTSNPKGLCVIINNVDFHSPRHGSNVDKDLLKRLFKKFKYKVRVLPNLTSQTIMSELTKISQEDHWLADSFICCVLSHGSLGSVFGVNNVAVKIRDILGLFSAANCPSLADKPKVFFLQACQGQVNQTGSLSLPKKFGSESGETSSEVQETGDTQSDAFIDEAAPALCDLESDLLLGYATPPGYKSYRNITEGSWYINELVDTLLQLAATEDILSILTKVNNDVAEKEGIADDTSVKQIPCPRFTLKKKLYLANKEDM